MKSIIIALIGLFLLSPTLTNAMPTEVFLDELATKENCGEGVYDPPRIVRSELEIYSYGDYCFKIFTFISQGKKYGHLPKDMEIKEAQVVIQHSLLQRKIARSMYQDGIACKSIGWLNSCKRIGII